MCVRGGKQREICVVRFSPPSAFLPCCKAHRPDRCGALTIDISTTVNMASAKVFAPKPVAMAMARPAASLAVKQSTFFSGARLAVPRAQNGSLMRAREAVKVEARGAKAGGQLQVRIVSTIQPISQLFEHLTHSKPSIHEYRMERRREWALAWHSLAVPAFVLPAPPPLPLTPSPPFPPTG
jgi:hypothetical protein